MIRSPVLAACLVTALLACALAAEAAEPDAIVGVWVSEDGEGFIEIRRHADVCEGTIVGGTGETGRVDEKNPDPELRDRPLLGLKIMDGFTYAGQGKWTDGRIYDPNSGKTYKCKMELKADDTLKVRGYVGVSWFGRTETWTRKTAPETRLER